MALPHHDAFWLLFELSAGLPVGKRKAQVSLSNNSFS